MRIAVLVTSSSLRFSSTLESQILSFYVSSFLRLYPLREFFVDGMNFYLIIATISITRTSRSSPQSSREASIWMMTVAVKCCMGTKLRNIKHDIR